MINDRIFLVLKNEPRIFSRKSIPTVKTLKYLINNSFFFLVMCLMIASPAYAAGSDDSIKSALDGLLGIMTGAVAQSVATIAVAGTGWAWMTGHISIKTATIIGMGIGIVFGASEIVQIFGAPKTS